MSSVNAQPQTGLEERVAEVVEAHQHDGWLYGDGEPQRCCSCGWSGTNSSAHVAGLVLAALGLTEESRI